MLEEMKWMTNFSNPVSATTTALKRANRIDSHRFTDQRYLAHHSM